MTYITILHGTAFGAIHKYGLLRGCEPIVGKVSSVGIGEDIEPYVRGVTFESRVLLGDTWVYPPVAAVPTEHDDGNWWRFAPTVFFGH